MHPRLDIVILNRYNPTLASLLVGGCKGFSTGQVDHGGDVCDGGDGGDGGDGANVDGYGGNGHGGDGGNDGDDEKSSCID